MRLNFEIGSWVRRIGIGWLYNRIILCSVGLICSLFILSLANPPTAQAQAVRVALKEMVDTASTIVTGRVVEVREGRHPDYPNVAVTYITMEVQEMLKGGANHQGQHVFMQFGGMGATRVSELPPYRVGEEVVLFLYPESHYGFTSPVGGSQGKFYLRTDPQTGERIVVDALRNPRAFEGISAERLSPAERTLVRGGGEAVSYQTFASLVKKLVKD